MEEMLDDALNVEEDEEVEVEADEEVDKVLFELTNGKLGQAGAVDTELPVSLSPGAESLLNSLSCIRFLRSRRRRQRGRWSGTGSSSTVYSVAKVWSFLSASGYLGRCLRLYIIRWKKYGVFTLNHVIQNQAVPPNKL
jgi:hypothetical protein